MHILSTCCVWDLPSNPKRNGKYLTKDWPRITRPVFFLSALNSASMPVRHSISCVRGIYRHDIYSTLANVYQLRKLNIYIFKYNALG